MGYRLHYAKVHKVEWEGGFYGGLDVTSVRDLLANNCDCFWEDENSDIWEVPKDEMAALIATLRKSPKTQNEYLKPDTNGEVADVLQQILSGSEPSESYIRLEWF